MSIADIFQTGERKADMGHFRNLVMVANVDGILDDSEIVLLHKIGQRIGLTYAQIGAIMDDPKSFNVVPPVSKDDGSVNLQGTPNLKKEKKIHFIDVEL